MKLHAFLKYSAAILCLFAMQFGTKAQSFPPKNYPQGYFQWPLKLARGLNANFGELRPNHYHMGLDCKTDKKQNIPVVAAAAGNVSRVKIEPFGFGRAIYVDHPNGTTSLYAHLNDFYPELEAYVTQQQYLLKSWAVNIDIPKERFPVVKGQFIAYSGNTGGSMGPHLHFEVRDTKTEKVLNPTLFDFGIPDGVAPTITRLALYDRCLSVYEQSPRFYPLKRSGSRYSAAPIIINTDKVSFGIAAFDTYTGSTNQNGIYEAVIFDNNTAIVGFQLDSIGYDETRYMNAHIDYRLKTSGGPYVQHVSKLPGNSQSVYRQFSGDGVINLEDGQPHLIKIEVRDADGNTSVIQFSVQRGAETRVSKMDSISQKSTRSFHPGFVNVFETQDMWLYLKDDALYDSIRFTYRNAGSANGFMIHQVHNAYTPVQSAFTLRLKAEVPAVLKNKVIMHRFWNNKNDYKAAEEENGWYKANFREFGYFKLLIDTVPPVVAPIGIREGLNAAKLSRIAFTVSDNCDDIKSFTANLDGKWLRFTNDKGKVFAYKFDEYCGPGSHQLQVIVEDLAGNITEKVYNFTR